MVRPSVRRASVAPGMSARPGKRMDQSVSSPGLGIDIRGRVAGGSDEFGVLRIGHRGPGDPIRAGLNRPTRTLAFVPPVLAGDAMAISLLVQTIGRFAFGAVRTGAL